VVYYDAYIVTDVSDDIKGKVKPNSVLREVEYQELKEKYGGAFKADIGAKAIRDLLSKVDLHALVSKLRRDFKVATGQKRMRLIKRLRVAEAFLNSGNRPEWMILEVVPVMPPDLRPMVQLEGGRFATSDLNDLYRRVLNRNNRLKKMINMGAPEMIIRNEKRMLQEAVDVLIDNGRRKRAVTGSTGRPLKSLSDIIEGKQGRFRQNLLGKRADYSGRSVIVIGPNLKMHQCGLPKGMALELFKPFVIRKLVDKGLSQNVKSAKRQIERGDVVVWDVLEEVIKGHPVLLNRAPTLHRLGIQAFEPILVEGKAIQIHPLVCPAFNADFDGDQMAVHVPLLTEAQVESRVLMLASGNILSPASGRPIVTPTQDMVLGSYYMTVLDDKRDKGKGMTFSSDSEAMVAHDLEEIHLHTPIKVRRSGSLLETTVGRIKFNYTLARIIEKNVPGEQMGFLNRVVGKKELEAIIKECHERFGSAVTAQIADEIKRLGFKYATLAGISISLDDLRVPAAKKKIIEKASHEVDILEKHYKSGTLSQKEKFIRSLDIWSTVTEEVTNAMLRGFDKLNPVYMMAFSGARGNLQQVRQLAGIRGLMADPSGNIINIPIKTNFKEGLSVTEYFISSYGARKGLVDTALRTADSGYLTRRLVDVTQDVMVTEDDCEVSKGIELAPVREGFEEVVPLMPRLIGRTALKNISDPISGKTIVKGGEEINEERAKKISDAGIEHVMVRSPLRCEAKRGICKKCYGRDLSSGKLISIGEAVGIIAAQSIGEPGTQLTMRTFHIGGVALHKTAKIAIRSKHAGKVEFGEGMEVKTVVDDIGQKVQMVTREASLFVKVKDRREEHVLPVGSVLLVKKGAHVDASGVLAEFDQTYEYIIASSSARVKFLNLEVASRKRTVEKKAIVEHLAKKDGEIFVYNPKVKKEYDIPKGGKPYVSFGDKVRVDTELTAGVASKTAGVVLEVRKAKSSKGKGAIVVVPGESYKILGGSKIMVSDGKDVEGHDVIAKVEAVRRDPSKTRDIIQGLPKVEELFEARKPKDAAILSDIDGEVEISESEGSRLVIVHGGKSEKKEYVLPYDVRLRVMSGDKVSKGAQLTEGTISPHEVLRILGVRAVQTFLVNEIQKIYRGQGVVINSKHVEVVVRQMTRRVRVLQAGDTTLLPGELIDSAILNKVNKSTKGESATATDVLLGITKASLSTDSFISAASFQETARVLTDAAVRGKRDEMYGLKENVIIGKLIPAGTGFHGYKNLELTPTIGGLKSAK
jgi:DNA-directed RNA polymerase subunit beta'